MALLTIVPIVVSKSLPWPEVGLCHGLRGEAGGQLQLPQLLPGVAAHRGLPALDDEEDEEDEDGEDDEEDECDEDGEDGEDDKDDDN